MRKNINYGNLPFNPNLKEQARENRKSGNLGEVLLWMQLKSKKLNGLDFDRQKIIGNYIVDFYCPKRNVVIEVDGESHKYKGEQDADRDFYMKGLGLTIIRIKDEDIKRRITDVMTFLSNHPALYEDTPPLEGN